jgi:hypothetical protein
MNRYDVVRAVCEADPWVTRSSLSDDLECMACETPFGPKAHHADCWWAAARALEGKIAVF